MLEIGIPTYNSRATLDRALASIAMQTERKRVLVTICDDCSTENYDDIIALFQPFLNIRCIKTDKNGGAGVARNEIIKNACGDFLMFLDADDALGSPLALKKLMHEIYRAWPDVTFGRFYEEADGVIIEKDICNSIWVHGKVWKTSFLQENEIYFPPIRYNEDSAFCTLANALKQSDLIVDFPIYCWLNNKNSTVRGMDDYSARSALDFIRGRMYVYNELISRNEQSKAEHDLCHNMVSIYYLYINITRSKPDMAQQYAHEWGCFLREIDFNTLIAKQGVIAYMDNMVNKTPFRPLYGIYTPHLTFEQFLNLCLEEKSENGKKN